jgi:hypothetical protein
MLTIPTQLTRSAAEEEGPYGGRPRSGTQI